MTAVGARVYLHSHDRRHYLASVVAGQAEALEAELGAGTIHVRTGWKGGPHYELHAAPAPGRPIDWPAIASALAVGARDVPAMPLSEAAYLHNAAGLGRIESVPPPYLPLRPHGLAETVGPLRSPGWHGRLGGHRKGGLALLLTPLLRTAGTSTDGALLARVAEAFLALGDCHPYGLRFGTFSFRSHAEAFFHWAGPAADYRSSFAARMEKDRSVLEELVRQARDGAESGPAAEWRCAFHACMERFTGHITEEELDRGAAAIGVRGAPTSAFHAAVAASGVIDQPPEWFAAYRLTINLFYELLPALDVSPVQRFYFCHAIAEIVDDAHGETWQARLAALESHLTVTP